MRPESGYQFHQQRKEFGTSREAIIQQTRQRMESLGLSQEDMPTRQTFFPYRSRLDMYARRYQAVGSDHDIRHADATMVLAHLMARYADSHLPLPEAHLNREALLMAGATHDVRRTGDYIETVLHLSRHGKLAADMVASFYPEIFSNGLPSVEKTLRLVQQIDTYHDIDRHAPQEARSLELQLFVIADRLELSRLHLSQKLLSKLMAPAIVRSRVHKYDGNIFSPYLAMFGPIADGLLLLSKEYLAKSNDPRNPDNHFAAVMQAAEDLGIIAPESSKQS